MKKNIKLSIIIIVTILLFVLILSMSIYYNQNLLREKRAEVDERLQREDQEYKDQIFNESEGVIEEDPTTNGEVLPTFDDFYSILQNAENYFATGRNIMSKADGSLTAKLVGLSDEDFATTLHFEQIVDKNNKQLFNYYQYGSKLPSIVPAGMENSYQSQIVYKSGTYYTFGAKDFQEFQQDHSTKFTKWDKSSFIEVYKHPINKLLYNINENTVESVNFLKSGSKYKAKVVLKDNANSDYNFIIQKMAGMKSAEVTNSVLYITFDKYGRFSQIQVDEEMNLVYEPSGFNIDVNIKGRNNYYQNFSYGKEFEISVKI